MTTPSVIDWGWFGRQTPEQIARAAIRRSEPATWIKHAYAWLHQRIQTGSGSLLPPPLPEAAASPRGPGGELIAFPAAGGGQHGFLGWAAVRFEPTASVRPTDDSAGAAWAAANSIADLFRQLDHQIGWPRVELFVSDAGGTSVGLAALIASLRSLLSIPIRDDFVATGCWDSKQNLAPVDPATLEAKLRVAERWGYRRCLVVEGQTGIPATTELEVVEIPRDPVGAMFAVVRAVERQDGVAAEAQPADLRWAKLLAVLDQATVRAAARQQDGERALATTQAFVSSTALGLSRHVAHDIRSRVYLHVGQTEAAAEERRLAESVRPNAMRFPEGWLGDYLKWHQAAHHAVLALDQGRWGSDEEEHRRLDRTLARLRGAIDDRQAGREELLAALFLSNTRARRLDFLGRLHRDSRRLEQAWDDLTWLRSSWEELFEYCREIGLRDSDLRRQQNCCLDVLVSRWHLEGQAPAEWLGVGRTFWPSQGDFDVEQLEPFDLWNLLRWDVVSGVPPTEERVRQVIEAGSEKFEQYSGRYPYYLPYEAVLRYRLGSAEQQQRAAERLARSCLFTQSLGAGHILAVLRRRAARLLHDFGIEVPLAELAPSPGESDGIRRLHEELLRTPETLVDRCPY